MEARRGPLLLRSKVARRLLWSFLLCAGVPILALAVLTFADVSRGLREQSEERLREAAKSSGLLLLDRLVQIRGAFHAAARSGDPDAWTPANVPLPPGAQGLLVGATLRRADGTAVALLGAAPAPSATPPPADSRGRITVRREPSGTTLDFEIPLPGERADGLLLAALAADRLVGDVLSTALPPRVEHCVIASSGVVLACSRAGLESLLPARSERHASVFEASLGEDAYFGAHWTLFLDSQMEGESWSIAVFEPKTAALAALARFRLLFPLLALACFGVVFLASVRRIRRQMEPLDRLQEATREVAGGRFDVAVPAGGGDEFGALAASFNAMAGQLSRQFGLLGRLIDLDREILSAADERSIVGALLDGMASVHPCAAVGVLLRDADVAERFSGWLGWTGERRREALEVTLPPIEQERLRGGTGVVELALGDREARLLAPLAAAGFTRARILPLESAAGLAGLLILADLGGGAAVPDPAVARQVADQAAVAIANARIAERNRFLAQRDALTGLANRQLFRDRLEQAIENARRGRQLAAVCMIDLDRFKAVNDGLGHAAGDRLLQQAGARMRAQARRGSLARMGGDEFTLLLPGVPSPEACSSILQRMLETLAAPFELDGREIFVTASAGVALYPIDGTDADDLLKHADAAMYEAKREGGDRLAFYTRSLSERASRRIALESALRRAVERDEIVPHYQPLADASTREWVGFEVLARWTDPTLGAVSPEEFIAVAEETGLIGALGERILERACEQARTWQIVHRCALGISVNLSARQLRDPELPQRVERVLTRTGLDPRLLVLELTESELMEDVVRGRHQLELLRRLGVRISLDDFGTGYSSLGYLRSFPVDCLKIDRRFLAALGHSAADDAILRAIVDIGHALELVVVAEGVEREEQRAALEALGCDLVQGWAIAPALSADEVAKHLDRADPARDV